MARIKNTSLKPIMLRAPKKGAIKEGVVAKDNLTKTIVIAFDDDGYEVGNIEKLRENKIIDSYFDRGVLVEVKAKKAKTTEKSAERVALEARAEELDVSFAHNTKDENLAAKVKEAEDALDNGND